MKGLNTFRLTIVLLILIVPAISIAQVCPTDNTDTDGSYVINSCCDLTQSNAVYKLDRNLTLQRNRNSAGDSCFEIDSANNVVLDLGGHTVNYDTWPVTNILNSSFESGSGKFATDWTYSNNTDQGASRAQNKAFWVFGGEHSIVIPANSPAQYIESSSVTLPANITYRAHVFFKGQRDDVYMSINGVCDNRYSVNQLSDPSQTTGAYFSLSCDYRPSTEVNARLRIGINSPISRDIIIDVAELRPAPSMQSPVFSALRSDSVTLRNGSIIQGDAKTIGNADGGSHIVSVGGTDNMKIHDMRIIGSGMQMMPIIVRSSDSSEIYNNPELRTNARYAQVRDRHMAVIWIWGDPEMPQNTRIHHNNLYTMQTGMRVNGQNMEIDNNNIYHNSTLSNGYAIAIRRPYDGINIHDNNITGIGRGVHITSGQRAIVHNNRFDLMEYPNPEYSAVYDFSPDAFSGYCAKGIHFEGGPRNAHIYGNTVITRQVDGSYPGCSLSMTHELAEGTYANNIIENNEFAFYTDYLNPDIARDGVPAFIYQNINIDGLFIRNNTYKTGSRAAMKFLSSNIGVKFDNPTFINESPFTDDFRFIHNDLVSSNAFIDFDFINPTAIGGRIDAPHALSGRYWNYFVSYYLTVVARDSNGEPQPNSHVLIEDITHGSTIANQDMTNGEFIIPIHSYEVEDADNNDGFVTNPYEYRVTVSSGDTTLPQRTFSIGSNRTEVFEFITGDDNTPPYISNGSPSGTLEIGTTQVNISADTHENATCRYSTNQGTQFNSMTLFLSTGNLEHTSLVTGLSDGNTYNYYIKCTDGSGNINPDDYIITFAVGSAPQDTTAPLRFNGTPSGALPSTTTSTNISINTNETAQCRYSEDPGTQYSSMGVFSNTNGTIHSTTISNLEPNSSYTFYIKCSDNSGNINSDDYAISFSINDYDINPQIYDDDGGFSVTGGCGAINNAPCKKQISLLLVLSLILFGIMMHRVGRLEKPIK